MYYDLYGHLTNYKTVIIMPLHQIMTPHICVELTSYFLQICL